MAKSNFEELNKKQQADKKSIMDFVTVKLKCRSEGQKALINSIKDKEVTFCTGPAGTGKTYLVCAQALKLLKRYAKYERIVIAKSVTAIPGEEIGFLKGTWEEKMEPFMWSYWTNFEKLAGKPAIDMLRHEGLIQVWPLAFIRGSNLDNAIVIIDESQNISMDTMKTILTRLGTDSKMILMGDEEQIDRKNKKSSALRFYINNFKDFEDFGIVELGHDDQVRNPLITKYLNKLEEINRNLQSK